VLFLSPGVGFLKMLFLPFPGREQSVRSPLKPGINPCRSPLIDPGRNRVKKLVKIKKFLLMNLKNQNFSSKKQMIFPLI
jgi:hypothetical protein